MQQGDAETVQKPPIGICPEPSISPLSIGEHRATRVTIDHEEHSMPLSSKQETLLGAAASGDKATVEDLLNEGVDPNGTTTAGQTALDVAATKEIRDLLIKKGGKKASEL